MLAAAQSLPAAGVGHERERAGRDCDASAGGTAQPLTFEAIVLGQIGNDTSSKRPLSGAAIEIRRQGDSTPRAQQAQSDDQGRVLMTIEGGPGDYQATARMNGYRPQSVRIMARAPGEHHAAEFVLSQSRAKSLIFQGVVYEQIGDDAATRRPLAGATLQLRRQGDAASAPGTTDAQGRTRLLLMPGDYQARASLPGWGRRYLDVSVRDGGANRADSSSRRRRRCRRRNREGSVVPATLPSSAWSSPIAGPSATCR